MNSYKWTGLAAAISGTLAVASMSAQAQTEQPPTDAGQTLKQLQKSPQPLPTGKALALPADIKSKLGSDGKVMNINGIRFTGNLHLDEAQLTQALGGQAAWSKPLDLVALRALVDGVTDHYRARGYPFARAFLLPGSLDANGFLNIQVVEGQYGQVEVVAADEKVVKAASPYLSRLTSGDVVETAPLERATLLVDDLPGYTATPVMKPGTQVGTGDLNVVVEQQKRVSGNWGLDNHGSAYSGEWRPIASMAINRLAIFGDELSLSALFPAQGSWMGSANYAAPVGAHGARVSLGLTRTAYALSDEFTGFNGTATEKTLGISYPIVRSRMANLAVSLSYKDKTLRDIKLGTQERKDVTVTPLVLSFDRRDNLGQGGITYGAFTALSGDLKTASSKTSFSRWQLDMARLQRVNETWNLYAHALVQGTRDNLDSSEGLSLGGASGVRAYPTGEASGDQGWMIQLEARKALGQVQAYAFFDYGEVQVDARPELVNAPAPDQTRAGMGLGLRLQRESLNMNLALAWRTQGGPPRAAGGDPIPRIWFSMNHAF